MLQATLQACHNFAICKTEYTQTRPRQQIQHYKCTQKKWTIQTAVHQRSTTTRSKNPNPKPKFHGHAANPRLKMNQKEETSQTAER
jgi:hypothetical protein